MTDDARDYRAGLPDGGEINLQSEQEVDKWETLSERYQKEYRLTKVNDLTTLGTLLQQHILLYRAQRDLSGMVEEEDEDGIGTGVWKRVQMNAADLAKAQKALAAASTEIRALEKQLGIDKASREASGSMTIPDYLSRLKNYGRLYGLHVTDRVKFIEEFVMELTWRLNLEREGDAEDRAYHDCTPEKILDWARERIETMEEKDKEWAKEVGALFVGKI